jgi:hypothetical protein
VAQSQQVGNPNNLKKKLFGSSKTKGLNRIAIKQRA